MVKRAGADGFGLIHAQGYNRKIINQTEVRTWTLGSAKSS